MTNTPILTRRNTGARLGRRAFLGAAVAAPFAAQLTAAENVLDLEWYDLLPDAEQGLPSQLSGIVEHNQADLAPQQSTSAEIRTDLDGKTVRIPGYIVPVDYDGTGVSAFILVPYVGACIHVPPPPPNQLVFVTTPKPYESEGLFEAVYVTGTFGAAATSTQLAEIGYVMTADQVEPYFN